MGRDRSSRRGGHRGGGNHGENGRNGDEQRYGGGRRDGGGRGRHRRSRHQRQSFDSGNKRERIAVESGHLVLIDQFMLANPSFIKKLSQIADDSPGAKDELIARYGGKVANLGSGTYRIHRNPYKAFIIIHPEGVRGEDFEEENIDQVAGSSLGTVLLDTRCLAMIDREILDDNDLLERYHQLWFAGQDKACRDLLRDNGGAVRYGFSRQSDDLRVAVLPDENVVYVIGVNQAPVSPQESEDLGASVAEVVA